MVRDPEADRWQCIRVERSARCRHGGSGGVSHHWGCWCSVCSVVWADALPASGTVEGMVLELYLANDIDDEQLQLIAETLTTQSGVIDWRYISKAEAYEAALAQYADSEDDLRIVEENPDHFTASIRLLVANATDMRVIRTFAFETFPTPDSGLIGGGGGWGTLANPPFGISLPWPPINGGWALESISISGVETAVGPGAGTVPLAWIEIRTALAGHADCTSFRGPPDGYSFTDEVLIPGGITVRNLECDSFIVDAFVGMLHDNPDGIDVEFTTSGMVWAAGQSRLVFSCRYLPAAIEHDGQNPKIPPELPSGEVTALPAIVLVKGAEVGDIYTTGFAADTTASVDLWQELGLVGSPPAIAFISRVVLYFGAVESSSCPLGPLLGLVYNHGNQSIHPLMSPVASAQDADSGVMTCTADA
ncbi:MAG: hypothetical protein BMS9Abin12_1966 [Acidimicrobiia bacterium]|nr:MAG: hypothetical protein BMS9Abin12_1966 [Acidimicrobiia bacterium]